MMSKLDTLLWEVSQLAIAGMSSIKGCFHYAKLTGQRSVEILEENGTTKQFPTLSKTLILMGHNYHSLSIDATIMVSKNCPITGEHVGIIFVTQ